MLLIENYLIPQIQQQHTGLVIRPRIYLRMTLIQMRNSCRVARKLIQANKSLMPARLMRCELMLLQVCTIYEDKPALIADEVAIGAVGGEGPFRVIS